MAHPALHWWYPQAYQKIQVAMYHEEWGNYKHEYPFSFLQKKKIIIINKIIIKKFEVHRNGPKRTKVDRIGSKYIEED